MGELFSFFRRQDADVGNQELHDGPRTGAADGAENEHPRPVQAADTSDGPREDDTNPPETLKRYLCVDRNLKFGLEEWTKALSKETTVKEKENIDEHLKLDAYPSDDILALFALRAYRDNPGDEAEDDKLPEGWKLLTTARSTGWFNGYFGAAFWCPALQQVVVAHRGTKPKNLGSVWADIKSVWFNLVTRHVCSAVTFTEAIATTLNEVKKEGVNFQLSITGHSLGGWLSQVTAFTAKYVQKDGTAFRKKSKDSKDGFHAHTVVFETGCKKMLSKMEKKFDFHLKKTIDLNKMDITSYLSAVNIINSVNMHLGIVYRVLNSDLRSNAWFAISLNYISNTHSMEKMYKAMKNNSIIFEMLDWPHGLLQGGKLRNHRKNTIPEENYHEPTENYTFNETDKNCRTLNIFSDDELDFLRSWKTLIDSKIILYNFIQINGLTVSDLFKEFEIDIKNQIVRCPSEEYVEKLIRQTKALMRWIPGEVQELMSKVPSPASTALRAEARDYFDSIKGSQVDFRDNVGLEKFLTSVNNILVIRTPDIDMEVARLANILLRIEQTWNETNDNRYSFVDLKIIKKLESSYDITGLFQSCFKDERFLFMRCTENFTENILNEISSNLKNNSNKLVLVESHDTGFGDILKNGNNMESICTNEIQLCDLAEAGLKIIFDKKIIHLQGVQLSLREFVGESCDLTADLNRVSELIGPQMLKTLLSSEIKLEKVLLHHDDLNVHSSVNKNVSETGVAQVLTHSPDALLLISGISPEERGTDCWKKIVQSLGEGSEKNIVLSDGEAMFKEECRKEPRWTIYWFFVSAGIFHCKAIYKNEFYIKRKFQISKYIFDFIKFAKNEKIIENVIFVFLNVNDKESLISRYELSENEKKNILESAHIETAATDKEADDFIREVFKNNPGKGVHVLMQEANGGQILWQCSRGSLEDLRPYVTAEIAEPVDEDSQITSKKVVIIADEPGMGKSTTLTSVARLLRTAWVVRVDLKDFPLENLPSQLCLNSVCKYILRDKSDWMRGLLQFCLDKSNEHSRDIFISFDGFDEVKPNAECEVLRLLEYLNNETKARVWVTTRPYRAEVLENTLSTFATRFEKITEPEQREFLANFWRPHLFLEVDNYGDAEKGKLYECVEYIYESAKTLFGTEVHNFMGIPLQMRMLADVCLPWVINIIKSKNNIEKKFDVTSVLDLYQRFIRLKYDIYFSDKTRLGECMSYVIKKNIVEKITEKHRMLGFRVIFPKFAEDHFGHDHEDEEEWTAELCRVGLVQAGGAGAEFTHRTLAEYHCAELAVEWLRRRGRYHGHAPVAELLLTEILLHKSNRVIRIFIDKLISQPLSEEVNKLISLKISEIWLEKQYSLFNEYAQTALHVAVREGSAGIVQLLLGGFRCAPERLIGFLAARDWEGGEDACTSDTALGRAARTGCEDMVRQIVGSLERCSYQVILELLLATYVTYDSVSRDKIILLSNYIQTTADCPEIKRAFTRTEEIVRVHIPDLHTAMQIGCAAWVGALCSELASGTEMLYCLLGSGGERRGFTPLHHLAKDPPSEEAAILEQISTTLRSQNISVLGRAYDIYGLAPLHLAARRGCLGLVEWLIHHGVWVDCPGGDGMTALWWAASGGQLEAAQCLIEKGADINIIDDNGQNLLFTTAHGRSLTLLQDLIDKGLNVNCVNNSGQNLLFPATHGGSLPVLQYLIDKGLDVNCVSNRGKNLLKYVYHADVGHFLKQQMAQRGGPGGEV